jgi:hypothetical protein
MESDTRSLQETESIFFLFLLHIYVMQALIYMILKKEIIFFIKSCITHL